MPKISSRDKVFSALNHQPAPIPWVELRVDNQIGGKILGRAINCAEDVKDWVDLAERVGLDCASLRFVKEMMMFGMKEERRESDGTYRMVPLLTDMPSLERLGQPLPVESKVRKRVKEAKEAIGNKGLALFAVFPICVTPATMAVGLEDFCLKLYDDLFLVEGVIDLYTNYCETLVEILSSCPEIDLIWLVDDIAFNSGTLFKPEVFREIILPRYQRVARKILKPWAFHSDGDLTAVLDDLLALGMSALHPIQPEAMDIFRVKEEIGDRVCLIGNLSLDILANGTENQVKEEVFHLARICGKGGGYMLSSSNTIADWVKPENVIAMGEAIKDFNTQLA